MDARIDSERQPRKISAVNDKHVALDCDAGDRPTHIRPVPIRQLTTICGCTFEPASGSPDDLPISGITIRAQDARSGDVFAAMPGAKVHGACFAQQAADRGAVAVLTDPAGRDILAHAGGDLPVLVHENPRSILGAMSSAIYGDPTASLTLIGITGTSGKTTTSYMTEAALSASGRSVGLLGTVETRIAGARIPSSLTTPEAPTLQSLYARMVERGVQNAVMEVSSHALVQGRTDGCHFAIAAFTNLSQDHLDFHPTMEDYFAAKSLLFAQGSAVHCQSAVICIDDSWGQRMARIAREAGSCVVTVSVDGHDAQWVAGSSQPHPDGSQTFSVTHAGRTNSVTIPLPGRYNVANALTALAIADVAGVDETVAITGISSVQVPGRVEKISLGQPFLAVVDYAHKPAAVEAVLATLRQQASGRVAIVLGAGGNRDQGKRPKMGLAAANGADLVVVTDDNPRDEDPASIRRAVLSGIDAHTTAEVREIGERAAAIEFAVRWAQPGDVVVVAGKGHESGQEVRGEKRPFDDRVTLADAIKRAIEVG